MYVHGVDLIRARDVNLPPPAERPLSRVRRSGTNFLGTYDTVDSFSTWQFTQSMTCPFPPCINPLARPIPQLGSINVFESAASSVYNGLTLSIRRRMTSGVYFRVRLTLSRTPSMTARTPWSRDVPPPCKTRMRRIPREVRASPTSATALCSPGYAPKPFHRDHEWLGRLFNDWKTIRSGDDWQRQAGKRYVTGDANQDAITATTVFPGMVATIPGGPDYATTDMRLSRRLHYRRPLETGIDNRVFQSFQSRQPAGADHRGWFHQQLRRSSFRP